MFGLFAKRSGKAVQSTRPEPTYEMSDSPVIGYVLLREVVSREQIIAIMNEHTDDEEVFEWDASDGDTLGCTINGLWVAISSTDVPFPDGEAQGALHPMFAGDDTEAIAEHRAFLLVAGMPGLSKGDSDDEATLSHLDAVANHVQVVRALLRLEEAVGYYSGDVETTYGKESYLAFTEAENPFAAAFLAPIWVSSRRDGAWDAYSIGLTKWGIPEVQVVGSTREPGDLFEYLMDIVGYLLGGARIRAGETLGRDEHEKITTSWQPSIIDEEETALHLEM
uniref:DUF4261 domain-containing protein n=1 Tax=Tessaracoccus timonensis TaxID=2161816 RepID=UPI000D55BABF|nr:DUF4261 domain-containing protein [Tessaracoccus timonensis]